jgi:hypothetical protein
LLLFHVLYSFLKRYSSFSVLPYHFLVGCSSLCKKYDKAMLRIVVIAVFMLLLGDAKYALSKKR